MPKTDGRGGRALTIGTAALVAATLLVGMPTAVGANAAPAEESASTPDPTRSKQLDGLFADLKESKSVGESRVIESKIWAAWLDSGDTEIDVMMTRAIAAMSGGDFVEAIGQLNRIIEIRPDYAEGWNKRATVYFIMKDYQRSLEDVARTLALEPRHFGALSGLGMIMVQLGDKRQALQAFKRALELDPNLSGAKEAIDDLEDELSKDI